MRVLLSSAILSVALATAAHATIVIEPGNPGNIGENVLFNNVPGGNGSGTTLIRGRTNQTDTVVTFEGTETLQTTGQGQDGITAADGAFTSLTVDTNPYFTNAVFAVRGTGTLTINGYDDTPLNLPLFYSEAFELKNGQNFFNLSATGGQLINYFTLATTGGSLTDFGQVRLGGFTNPNPPDKVVPGPVAGAGIPALLALGGFVWARRRKAGSTQA